MQKGAGKMAYMCIHICARSWLEVCNGLDPPHNFWGRNFLLGSYRGGWDPSCLDINFQRNALSLSPQHKEHDWRSLSTWQMIALRTVSCVRDFFHVCVWKGLLVQTCTRSLNIRFPHSYRRVTCNGGVWAVSAYLCRRSCAAGLGEGWYWYTGVSGSTMRCCAWEAQQLGKKTKAAGQSHKKVRRSLSPAYSSQRWNHVRIQSCMFIGMFLDKSGCTLHSACSMWCWKYRSMGNNGIYLFAVSFILTVCTLLIIYIYKIMVNLLDIFSTTFWTIMTWCWTQRRRYHFFGF